MYKKSLLLSSFITLTLITTGCSNRKCVGPQAHNGLYNALTCDYDANIVELKIELDQKTLERNKLFHEYQRLIAEVTNQTEKLNNLNKEVKLIEDDISSIETLLTNIKNKNGKGTLLTVAKLKSKLKRLNHDILNKSTFFDLEDAEYTNQEFTKSKDITKYKAAYSNNALKNQKYAANYDANNLNKQTYSLAYNNNLLKDKKYAANYNTNPKVAFASAYEHDIQNDKNIRLSLSSKIKTLNDSITTNNIESSIASINALINETKQYKDSIQSSAS